MLAKEKLDALLVTNPVNVQYLSGFSGCDSWFLAGLTHAVLLTDSRYTEQAEAECLNCRVFQRNGSLYDACSKFLKSWGVKSAGFEADSLTYAQCQKLTEFPSAWRPLQGSVERLRMIKDPLEIEGIRRAISIAEEAFVNVSAGIRPGMTEIEVAGDLDAEMRRLGACGSAFETIVLFGERTSLPHGRPSLRKLHQGDPVLIDWGARAGLYNSDLTRMLLPSTIKGKLERIYLTVLEAHLAAVDAARPGMAAKQLDAVARDHIKSRRMGKRFGHGLGHGVGMEVHEAPHIAASAQTELKAGMVFTIEPGIYLPGWGGVRIENMIRLTRNSRQLLTHLPVSLEKACIL